jgi:MraZ protein
LLIPKLYQTYASLEKDVVVVGMGTRIELWNPDQYLKNIIVDTADLSGLMEKYLS